MKACNLCRFYIKERFGRGMYDHYCSHPTNTIVKIDQITGEAKKYFQHIRYYELNENLCCPVWEKNDEIKAKKPWYKFWA